MDHRHSRSDGDRQAPLTLRGLCRGLPLAALALLALLPGTALAQVAFAPVQAGPAAGDDLLPYHPARLLVQLTEAGMLSLQADLPPEKGAARPGALTGIPSLDALARQLGIRSLARAYGEPADLEAAQRLGTDRWLMVELAGPADIPAAVARLQADPSVAVAVPDWRAFPAAIPNDPYHDENWGHNNTAQLLSYNWSTHTHEAGSPVGTVGFDSNAQAAWDAAQGYGRASIVIAIIDSGVDVDHPDLRLVTGYDYGDNDANPDDNSAEAGHGTCCAGVAAAIVGNALGANGAAGGCSVMPLKVADSAGSMYFSSIQNALYYAADHGAKVASMSLGAAISSDPATDTALQYAFEHGVTLLAAAGNENASTVSYPACSQYVIAVGAASPCGERKRSSSLGTEVNPGVSTDPNGCTCDGERWWGSNYGSTTRNAASAVDVIAPTILPTTDIGSSGGYASGDTFMWFNGTSCATPYAAGVCGLILSANPTWTPTQVRTQLRGTAQDVVSVESGTGWDRYAGYGMVDAAAAVGGGTPPVQSYTALPYTTGFETGSLDQYWKTAVTANGRATISTANTPHAGTRHLLMDDATSGGYSQVEGWLHLNLTGHTQVTLDFWWKDFGDETHTQDGLYFSSNGGASFVKVYSLNGASYTNNTWQHFTLDLDALAATAGLTLTPTFVVKFQQYDDYPIATDGMAFDDIAVTGGGGGGQAYATLPYTTGFEAGTLDQYWATAVTANGRSRLLTTNTPHAGSYHLVMDDATSGGYSQVEGRLHLNLTGQTQVTLDFWWKDFGDETHTQDGVYFSSNGGTSFVKVHNLNGGSYTNNVWQHFTLDLDALAATAGLTLTSTFVVKFQQYDDYPIATDGVAFDDIEIAVSGGGGGQSITAESEPNETSGTADGPVGTGVAVTGAISTTTDNDWFRFDVATAGNVNISLAIGGSADLDWFLYNSALTEVARGYTTSNPEVGSYSAAAGRYYLKVNGYNGAVSSYTLTVTGGLAMYDDRAPQKQGSPPLVFALRQNAPNPFNPKTTIAFDLPRDGRVTLRIYDQRGRCVRTLLDAPRLAGRYQEVWDGRDDRNAACAAGLYIYRLETPQDEATRKMVLIK